MDCTRPGAALIAASAFVLAVLAGTTASQAVEPAQPVRLAVSAAGCNCPRIEGAFVVLLDPKRGFLLLAGRGFPGGRGPAVAKDGTLSFALPDGPMWTVDRVEVSASSRRVWYARYPFRGTATNGCVAFDRERFSSEGDVVSYVHWLVEKVYLKLPEAERRRFPAFTLSNHRIRLRVEREGYAPLVLAGNEAAAMAFRFAPTDRSVLLVPYMLDGASARLAIEVALAADLTAPGTPRESLGMVVASSGETVPVESLSFTLTVEGVDPGP